MKGQPPGSGSNAGAAVPIQAPSSAKEATTCIRYSTLRTGECAVPIAHHLTQDS